LDLAYYSFRTGTPNHALQRTEAGDETFRAARAWLRQPLSL